MKLSFRPSARIATGAASALAVGMVAASSAGAAPAPPYTAFAQCPTGDPSVSVCVVSDTTSGTIKLGNQAVPINKRIRLQGGLKFDSQTFESTFVPAANGQSLEATPLDVPGGLAGITVPSSLPQPVRGLLEAAINSFNGVKATATLVGPVGFNFNNLLSGQGIAVELPLRVKLDNPFLGDNCYIGSAAAPVRFRLTNGTTTPPAGAAPMVGSPGTLGATGDITTVTGQSLVDNTFAVPRASGCGGVFSALIDPVVNLKIGLPSAPGVSTARLNGDAQIADAALVAASDQ